MSDFSTFMTFLSVSIRLRNGDQFGNRSQTLKTVSKLVNQANQSTVTKCPKTAKGGFTALGTLLLVTAVEIVKNKEVLHEFMLHTSRPVPKICSNTVLCITFSTMLVIWHYWYTLQCQILVRLSHF